MTIKNLSELLNDPTDVEPSQGGRGSDADWEARLLIKHYCGQIASNIFDTGMSESHFQNLCVRPLKRVNELMDQLGRKR
jgi:hypothetical protein